MEYQTCESCQKETPTYCASDECNNTHAIVEETILCHDCFMDKTAICDTCEETYHTDHIYFQGTSTYCFGCFDASDSDDSDLEGPDIQYVIGDALRPNARDCPAVIVHICNDRGRWGKGFVMAISDRWNQPAVEYHRVHKLEGSKLGTIQIVPVEDDTIWVVNMIAQEGLGRGKRRVHYDHLRTCLVKVSQWIMEKAVANPTDPHMSVHMPRIGCGLGGGSWPIIEDIIDATLAGTTIPVFVYDQK